MARGALLGGYNEFCEYAKMFYDQEMEMKSTLAKDIAEENRLVQIKNENDTRQKNERKKPFNITITNATSPLAYQLMAAILKKGAVFDGGIVKDGLIINTVGSCGDEVKGVLMELEDLAEGQLCSVKMFSSLESALKTTDLLLILDENDKKENESRIEWINRNREQYSNYGRLLKSYQNRVFLSGQFATLGAYLILKASEKMSSNQILVSASANENSGRGCIGRKLGLNASKIHHVMYYGSSLDQVETSLFSTQSTTVQGIESAIFGPENYHRALDEVLFDNEWKSKAFDLERRATRVGPIAQSAAIVKALNNWFSSGSSTEVISCGTLPDADTTLTSTFLCLPGNFVDGKFVPLPITLSEAEKVRLIEVDRLNKRDELISTLSEAEQAEFVEEERLEKHRAEAEARLEKEMSGPVATAAIPEIPEEPTEE